MREIEVFRAGTSASKGITAADLQKVVASYNPALRSAPVVKGHPQNDMPAYGIIQSLRQDGNRLFATLGDLAGSILDELRLGRWINRSMAFWAEDHPSNPTPGALYAKHLGFLGAAQPAIPGMDPMTFAAEPVIASAPDNWTARNTEVYSQADRFCEQADALVARGLFRDGGAALDYVLRKAAQATA
ncbi:hypothetical protein ACSMXM_04900 [Pacificimonas sp. ICDLI1SI03]